MTENTPEKLPDAPAVEEAGADLPEVTEEEATGYAVYDHTLLRYVTGVSTKAEANKAAKAGPEGHQLEVRKV